MPTNAARLHTIVAYSKSDRVIATLPCSRTEELLFVPAERELVVSLPSLRGRETAIRSL
jgi:hypothetical protein